MERGGRGGRRSGRPARRAPGDQTVRQVELRGRRSLRHVPPGLHRRQRQARQVSPSLRGQIRLEAFPQGAMPDRRASHQLVDDARPQQRQETHGRAHREARLRNHPLADGNEPAAGVGDGHHQLGPPRRLDPYRARGYRPPSGRRRVSPQEGQPGHMAAVHRLQGSRLPQHQDDRRVPRRRAHQRREGILQLVRHQKEGRARESGQV